MVYYRMFSRLNGVFHTDERLKCALKKVEQVVWFFLQKVVQVER